MIDEDIVNEFLGYYWNTTTGSISRYSKVFKYRRGEARIDAGPKKDDNYWLNARQAVYLANDPRPFKCDRSIRTTSSTFFDNMAPWYRLIYYRRGGRNYERMAIRHVQYAMGKRDEQA